MRILGNLFAAFLLGGLYVLWDAAAALACGCLSPPLPLPDSDFAVNQQAEQIIFEVEDGTVTAHVLIRYAGDPEQFGWLVPVPAVPELDLTPPELFGMLDNVTAPELGVFESSLCPPPRWHCEWHPEPDCGDRDHSIDGGASFDGDDSGDGDSGDGDGDGAFGAPRVDVLQRQVIGSYDTVVLGGAGAQEVVDWLNDEGFIVNDTMTPFMQPYLDEGMLFVAAKLVPGADSDEIRPLQMRYAADQPMIPLQLTAVAAEPHLTVTAYIFGEADFRVEDHPEVEVGGLSLDRNDRVNYPMAMARAIDEAGGDGFVREYAGEPPRSGVNDPGGWCDEDDFCGLAGDGVCQCPGADFEADDCAEEEDLVAAQRMMGELADKHPRFTRWTTRLSPEEMTFDPRFELDPDGNRDQAALRTSVGRLHLLGCEDDVVDRPAYDAIVAVQDCAAVYCGAGVCVGTEAGVGCACDNGFVARRFTDLDGQPSVTCVPDEAMVDLAAGGIQLRNACEGMPDVLSGSCLDVGGFAATGCQAGTAAVDTGGELLDCAPITDVDQRPGGSDYSAAFTELDVCFPKPGSCGVDGWLVESGWDDDSIVGVVCEENEPHESWTIAPPEPTCSDRRSSGGDGDGDDAADLDDADVSDPRPEMRTEAEPDGDAEDEEDGGLCSAGGRGHGGLALPLALAFCLLLMRRRRLA